MRRRTGVAVVEVTEALESFDFSTAEQWDVLVLHESVPVARLQLPSPGAVDSADLARALIWPHAEWACARSAAERLLPAALRTAPRPALPPSCSVVVCTRGRPDQLLSALAGLALLDPTPLEVIVVDNDPGERDCEAEVRRRGFVYIREDRRGLDNARNAAVRAARGDVIVFCDDDCVFPTGWLRALDEAFADPLVAAVTGPAFPHALDTPARIRMEHRASLTRGLAPRTFDWTLISPVHGGQAGAGANMAIRGDLLRAVHEPFPPELDAGTETRSGGDTYVFIRLLAAGYRITYDPRLFVFHQHRAHWRALDETIRGYGTGVVSTQVKLLVEDGELEAPRAMLWLLTQYAHTQWRRLVRRADAVDTRLAWSYVRGGLVGVHAWRRALRRERAMDPELRAAVPFPPPTARPLGADAEGATMATHASVGAGSADGERPAISVVVPTVCRPEALSRCLTALATQTLPEHAYEVIVVDDAPVSSVLELPVTVRLHRTAGQGAAAARNAGAAVARGDLLLFLDDDLVATPTLLARHVARHAQGEPEAVVIGYSPPRPPRPGLAALAAAMWWEDHFRALANAHALTFTEALSGNVSMRREAFLAGRRFEPAFARLRREDWEWGYRLLDGGAQLRYEHSAVARHEYELGAGQRIRACRAEARGDVLLVERHPRTASYLPLAGHRPGRPRSPRAALMQTLGHPRADRGVHALLAGLERARLRRAWSWLYRRAQREAYAHGLRQAGWRAHPICGPPVLDVDTSAADLPPQPLVLAPAVRLWHEGRQVACVEPRGAWGPQHAVELAQQWAAGDAAPRSREPSHAEDVAHDVLVLSWPDRWPQALQVCEASSEALVAFMLPGRVPSTGWFGTLAPCFEAPRVMLALGQLLDPGAPPEPLTLHETWRDRIPYAPVGGPADYLVVRRDALGALRRASAFADYGPMAIVLACAEEILRSGALVARRNVYAMAPVPSAELARGVREREKLAAWGSLLGEQALTGRRPRAIADTVVIAVGNVARAALRRHRGRSPDVAPLATCRALATGFARAVRCHARR